MNALRALLVFLGVVLLGVGVAWFKLFFIAVIVPYAAVVLFLVGFSYRILRWAWVPVPFRITTTCGQQKSLPWIKPAPLDNPSTSWGALGRLILEVLLFRSLFRNTKVEFRDGRPVYGGAKWLWLAGLAFHWSFLFIVLRHLRFFTDPAQP
jgi:nitrate reductase gamma subunit